MPYSLELRKTMMDLPFDCDAVGFISSTGNGTPSGPAGTISGALWSVTTAWPVGPY